MSEENKKKRRCYYWKQWKYFVDAKDISLKGWIEWCDELYFIQHKKRRPASNHIFVNPDMDRAMVKARIWNKDKIEKWLNDHGYKWTMTVETRYQFPFENENEVILVDADANVKSQHKQ